MNKYAIQKTQKNIIKIEEFQLKLYTFLQNYAIFYKINKFSKK